eukprot:265201-Pyramimonas_sp.AAC.1
MMTPSSHIVFQSVLHSGNNNRAQKTPFSQKVPFQVETRFASGQRDLCAAIQVKALLPACTGEMGVRGECTTENRPLHPFHMSVTRNLGFRVSCKGLSVETILHVAHRRTRGSTTGSLQAICPSTWFTSTAITA